METKSFLMTMGAGMVAGAFVGMLVPKKSELHKAAEKAAKSVSQVMQSTASDLRGSV